MGHCPPLHSEHPAWAVEVRRSLACTCCLTHLNFDGSCQWLTRTVRTSRGSRPDNPGTGNEATLTTCTGTTQPSSRTVEPFSSSFFFPYHRHRQTQRYFSRWCCSWCCYQPTFFCTIATIYCFLWPSPTRLASLPFAPALPRCHKLGFVNSHRRRRLRTPTGPSRAQQS